MGTLFATVLLLAGVGFFTRTMLGRVGAMAALKGEPKHRLDRLGERTAALLQFGFGQRRMLDPEEFVPGLMHVFVFGAFMVLTVRTVMLFVMAFSPAAAEVLGNLKDPFWSDKAALAGIYGAYLLLKDVFAAAAVLGVTYFAVLRAVVQPARMTKSWEAYLILGFIGALMLTEFVFGASHLREHHQTVASTEPVTTLVAQLLSGVPDDALHVLGTACHWIHLTIILVFLNFLPFGKHFHVVVGLGNIFLKRLPEKPGVSTSAKLSTPNLEKEEFGSKIFTDLTWKQGLDLNTCTECGRCQTHCPTYITGKPLTHKAVNQTLKHWMWDHQKDLIASRKAPPPPPADGAAPPAAAAVPPPIANLVGDILKPETVWACTTCGWCETACPVFIENVPRLIDMRRHKVQVESDFPTELQRVFEGMERQGNPWGIGQEKRDEWEGDVPLPKWGDGNGPYEYLFFVGCAGSYDDRMKKVSKSVAKILTRAGIKFATLGKEETCTGDSARRAGNEYLYQTLAKTNVEAWNAKGIKAVITQCPHCFNTIKNEYPEFGGNYDVISHTELINRLLKDSRVKLSQVMKEKVTYHDPCYLGRHNGVFDAPREALAAVPGLEVVEMQRSKRESFCCGAGGSRMWMEEKIGSRINHNRANEAALTLAHSVDPSIPYPDPTDKKKPGQVGDFKGPATGTVAVACPFCHTMVRDGLADTGRAETMKVKDVAELVADAMEPGPEAPKAG